MSTSDSPSEVNKRHLSINGRYYSSGFLVLDAA